MKLENIKHEHSLTSLLKILIFSLLMLAPMISVGVKCLYVVHNKNAYMSYYGGTEQKYQYIDVDSFNDLEESAEYKFQYGGTHLTLANANANTITYENVKLSPGNLSSSQIDAIYNGSYFTTTDYTNNYLVIYNSNGVQLVAINLSSTSFSFNFDLVNYTWNGTTTYTSAFGDFITKVEYNHYAYMDNVFEYSIHSLETNDLYTWTKNTGVYTGVNAMTSGLGIEGTVIPILITYWFLLTVIYIIIDIVLKLFTVLTHMIGNKKA